MKRWVWLALQAVLGAAMLGILLHFADLGRVAAVISGADALNLLAATFFFLSASVAVGYSLHVLLGRMGYGRSPIRTVLVSIAGQLLSDLTPARTGYFVTPILLNSELGITLEDGMAATVFTGGVHAFMSFALGVIAVAYFSRFITSGLEMAVLSVLGLLPLAVMGLALISSMHHGWLGRMLDLFAGLPLVKPRLEQLKQAIRDFQASGRRLSGVTAQLASLLLLSHILNSIAFYFLSASVGIQNISIIDYAMTYSIAGFTMYAFLTIAGLGIQEGMYAFLLGLLNVALDKATSVALLARFFFTVTDLMGVPTLSKVGLGSISRALGSEAERNKRTSG